MADTPKNGKGISREILLGLFVAVMGGLIVWWITEALRDKPPAPVAGCSEDFQLTADALKRKGDKYNNEIRLEAAHQCYQMAADAGSVSALKSLGDVYYFGYGVPQDYEQARQWYEKAAAGGNVEAMEHLGFTYEYALGGMPRDYEQARQWYEKAAAGGNAEAKENLAKLLKEIAEIPLWEKAAVSGDAEAMYHMGVIYENGEGVPLDGERAYEWYEKAAAAGNAFAKESLRRFSNSNH